jgi:hypothetical protein
LPSQIASWTGWNEWIFILFLSFKPYLLIFYSQTHETESGDLVLDPWLACARSVIRQSRPFSVPASPSRLCLFWRLGSWDWSEKPFFVQKANVFPFYWIGKSG